VRNPKGLWQAVRALLPDRNACPKITLTLGAYRAEFVTAPRYAGCPLHRRNPLKTYRTQRHKVAHFNGAFHSHEFRFGDA
jgi:hypothetical protein